MTGGAWRQGLRYAPLGMCVLFACAWALSFFVPLYNDEISFPFITSRAGWDGAMLGMRPACVDSYGAGIPLLLWPGRLWAWWWHMQGATPALIRLQGMAGCLLWLGAASLGLSQGGGSVKRWALWLVALCSLGVLPFMMVLTRPELSLSLGLIAYMFAPFVARGQRRGSWLWALVAGYLLLTGWFVALHPKALFFTPLMLPFLWQLWGKDRRACAVTLAVAGLMLWQALGMWLGQLDCPDYRPAGVRQHSLALLPDVVVTSPVRAALVFWRNLTDVRSYVWNMQFTRHYPSDWLPLRPLGWPHVFCNVLMGMLALCVFLATPLMGAWRMRGKGVRALRTLEAGMPLLLWLCLVVMGGFQTSKNFYDTLPVALGFILCACMSLRVFCLRSMDGLMLVSAGACASLTVLLASFLWLPGLTTVAGMHGQLPNQPKSSSILYYGVREDYIRQVARVCGIEPGMAHVVVDQYTYLAFREGFEPVYEIRSGLAPLQSMDAAGVITACSSLPLHLRDAAVQDHQLCCVSHKTLMKVPARLVP